MAEQPRVLSVPPRAPAVQYYVVYDPALIIGNRRLHLFTLSGGKYEPLDVPFLAGVNLGLKEQRGVYLGLDDTYLRWCDKFGNLLLTAAEKAALESARAEREFTRAEREAMRAERESMRAQRESVRADSESTRAQRAEAQAAAEAMRAGQAESRANALRALLLRNGIDPDQ